MIAFPQMDDEREPHRPAVKELLMRYTPVALALSLAVAVTSSVALSAERQADPRAAALIAEGRSELASGQVQAAIDSFEAALAIDPARRNLAQLESRCGGDCAETRELAAALARGPQATVLTAEAVTPDTVVTQN